VTLMAHRVTVPVTPRRVCWQRDVVLADLTSISGILGAGTRRAMPELADLLQLERRSDLPAIRPGDTVRVHVRVVEGNRERPQLFEGVVLEVK
jgi:hypothetical protein